MTRDTEGVKLTPLELSALADCVKRGSTRTNEDGLVDTLLSGLCSKPSLDDPFVRWSMNPNSRTDGYISLYTPTDLGRAAIAKATSTNGQGSGG
jgi:hypothetical protein